MSLHFICSRMIKFMIIKVESALFTDEANRRHAAFYYEKTLELIADKSYYPIGSSQKVVDIVREVLNYAPLHWIISHVVRGC
jgi:linoleate 10R-lipoxygenase